MNPNAVPVRNKEEVVKAFKKVKQWVHEKRKKSSEFLASELFEVIKKQHLVLDDDYAVLWLLGKAQGSLFVDLEEACSVFIKDYS